MTLKKIEIQNRHIWKDTYTCQKHSSILLSRLTFQGSIDWIRFWFTSLHHQVFFAQSGWVKQEVFLTFEQKHIHLKETVTWFCWRNSRRERFEFLYSKVIQNFLLVVYTIGKFPSFFVEWTNSLLEGLGQWEGGPSSCWLQRCWRCVWDGNDTKYSWRWDWFTVYGI